MLYRKPRVGQEISSYCGKCKEERSHTVAAMDGEAVKKVTCSMCGGTHNFKPVGVVAPAKERRTKPAASASRKTKASQELQIDPSRPVRSYNMQASFSAGDIINHPKFGLGSVETALPPNKIEVRFQDGKKMLLHNMKNS